MKLQSILAMTDLSARGRHAVHRAALIAADHRALLKIMRTPSAAGTQTPADSAAQMAALAREIAERFGILVKTVAETAGRAADVAEQTRWVDLLVVSDTHGQGFSTRPIERLLRAAACPVLATRHEALRRYRRILVTVDFSAASKQLVQLAWGLDSAAEIELFHALGTVPEARLRRADLSEHAIKAHRHQCMGDARERMFWLTDASAARHQGVVAAIGRGDPARQAAIQLQAGKAELLVVGKRRRSALADALFGSVAQRVLRWCDADVLVMPHARHSAARALAAHDVHAPKEASPGAPCALPPQGQPA